MLLLSREKREKRRGGVERIPVPRRKTSMRRIDGIMCHGSKITGITSAELIGQQAISTSLGCRSTARASRHLVPSGHPPVSVRDDTRHVVSAIVMVVSGITAYWLAFDLGPYGCDTCNGVCRSRRCLR